MWVGSADFQITFWGPEKKVQGVVIWFVLENVLGAILKFQRP